MGKYAGALRKLYWDVFRTSYFNVLSTLVEDVLRTSVGNVPWQYMEDYMWTSIGRLLGKSSGRPRDVILRSWHGHVVYCVLALSSKLINVNAFDFNPYFPLKFTSNRI